MDAKERIMIEHYGRLIENRKFDEYDILGFLIVVRGHLDPNHCYIREFADLIAHRKRKIGIVHDSIIAAESNNYQMKLDGAQVVGYYGMSYKTWCEQWKAACKQFGISIDKEIIREITICVFSLAQNAIYVEKDVPVGRLSLFQFKGGYLGISTVGIDSNSPYVGFSIAPKMEFVREFPAGLLGKPVETIREEGFA